MPAAILPSLKRLPPFFFFFLTLIEIENSSHFSPPKIESYRSFNRNTRKRCEIYSKLRIKTPDNVTEVLVFLLLTFNIFHT